jgi:SNF2 family DNA or RNA helicase
VNLEEFISQSQKLERMLEMIEEILERGEKCIIFSQFTRMGELMQKILEHKYHFPVLFFHGGVPEAQRQQIVDAFQSPDLDSPPILILSLRAGGIGLNLTQAQTVFHFDRWYNPAVEDQATDRAYRIGQKHQVNVYKYISLGTIEEKIDTILTEKRNLADQIMSSAGDTWITDLSDQDLREMFSLKTTQL